MTGWVCQWRLFWITVEDSVKKAYVEECVLQVNATSERSNSEKQGDVIPETRKVSMPVSSSPREPMKNQDTACYLDRIEAPLPPLQPRSTCERLELPFSCDIVRLRGTCLITIGSAHFTMWKWYFVTSQEASDYVEHDFLQERFHLTHFAGCAILFNKDISHPDISVKSIYLHDTRQGVQDHIVGGEQGWVSRGVLSRTSFRRTAVSGQKNGIALPGQRHRLKKPNIHHSVELKQTVHFQSTTLIETAFLNRSLPACSQVGIYVAVYARLGQCNENIK